MKKNKYWVPSKTSLMPYEIVLEFKKFEFEANAKYLCRCWDVNVIYQILFLTQENTKSNKCDTGEKFGYELNGRSIFKVSMT